LNAADHGVELASSVVPNGSGPNDGRRPLSVAVADFLEDTKLSKKPKTLAAYKTALNYSQNPARSCTSKTSKDATC
jgi:hypothetical protein